MDLDTAMAELKQCCHRYRAFRWLKNGELEELKFPANNFYDAHAVAWDITKYPDDNTRFEVEWIG